MPINWKFIEQLEGTSLRGYVPQTSSGEALGQSGVTIGTGFDLGQWTYDGVARLGLPVPLLKKLAPYIGLKKEAAIAKLRERPLVLTSGEMKFLDRVVQQKKTASAETLWNRAKPYTAWKNLTDAQQTVVASVHFQYGHLPSRTPNFWRKVTAGRWGEVVWHLRNFGDRYSTRRNKEADILEKSLKNKGNIDNGRSI